MSMFSSFFRRTSDGLPPTTPLQAQRNRQIESLRVITYNITEIHRDSEYQVAFPAGDHPLALRIVLPSSFPHEAPIVSIHPPVRHHWVDENQNVISPSVLAFSMHSHLGRTIQGIITEFQLHPPEVLGSVTASSTADMQPGKEMSSQLPCMNSHNAGQYQLSGTALTFERLSELSLSELERLHDNEDSINEFLEQLPEVQELLKQVAGVIQQNNDLAKNSLMKKPIIEDKKRVVLEKLDHLNTLKTDFDNSSQMFDMLSDAYSPPAIQDRLKVAALEAEEDSEKIAESFLDGKMSTEDFIGRFMEKRTLSHHRRARDERLQQQLLELQKAGF